MIKLADSVYNVEHNFLRNKSWKWEFLARKILCMIKTRAIIIYAFFIQMQIAGDRNLFFYFAKINPQLVPIFVFLNFLYKLHV